MFVSNGINMVLFFIILNIFLVIFDLFGDCKVFLSSFCFFCCGVFLGKFGICMFLLVFIDVVYVIIFFDVIYSLFLVFFSVFWNLKFIFFLIMLNFVF